MKWLNCSKYSNVQTKWNVNLGSTSKLMLMSCFSETSLNEFLKLSGRRQCLMHPWSIWTSFHCVSSVCLVTFFSLCLSNKSDTGGHGGGDRRTHVRKEHRRRERCCQWLFLVCVSLSLYSPCGCRCGKATFTFISSFITALWSECAVHTDQDRDPAPLVSILWLFFSQIPWLFCFLFGDFL